MTDAASRTWSAPKWVEIIAADAIVAGARARAHDGRPRDRRHRARRPAARRRRRRRSEVGRRSIRTPTSSTSAASSTGREELQIVCGAPNVRAGMKAPLAHDRREAAERHRDQAGEAARRRVVRHAVLGARARASSDDASGLLDLPARCCSAGDDARRRARARRHDASKSISRRIAAIA